MASKIKVDQLETADGTGTIVLQNQLSGMTSASMPTGSVIQVVNTVNATEVGTTSSTYTDTGTSLTITPTSTSSKILVISSNHISKETNDTWGNLRCYRDSTEIGGTIIMRRIARTGDSGRGSETASFTILDSPSSTSSLTYKIQMNSNENNATVKVNYGSGSSTLCLMEIKG